MARLVYVRFCTSRTMSADQQIFPVTYVEPLPEPTTAELQREAQEEAQVFASLGTSQLQRASRS